MFGHPRVSMRVPINDKRFSGGGEKGGGSQDRSPYSEKCLSGSQKESVDPVALLSSLPPPPSASEYIIENLYEDHFSGTTTTSQLQQHNQLRRSSGISRSYPDEKAVGELRRRGGVPTAAQGWSSFPSTPALSASPGSPSSTSAASLTVGALWKRGLAIAGAVGGAAAEVTGSRGISSRASPLQQQQQRWYAGGERQARPSSGDSVQEGSSSGFGGGDVRGGVGEWRGSPVTGVQMPTPQVRCYCCEGVATVRC